MTCPYCGRTLVEVDNPMRREMRHRRGEEALCPGPHRLRILDEVAAERIRQDTTWGQQNHPDGTGPDWAIAGQRPQVLLAVVRDALARANRPSVRLRAPGGEPFDSDHDPTMRAPLENGYEIEEVPAAGPTWLLIALEEALEAFSETDPVKLRAELVQLGAVVVAWIEAIDRR